MGLGNGNQITVLVGERAPISKTDRRLHQTLISSCIGAFVVAVIVALLGFHLMTIFTSNPDVIKLGATCLWCDAILQPFKAGNINAHQCAPCGG